VHQDLRIVPEPVPRRARPQVSGADILKATPGGESGARQKEFVRVGQKVAR